VSDLSFRYPHADRPALRHVGFGLQSGEALGLLGPSGAGKSTLMKILVRLLPVQQGYAAYEGRELSRWDRSLFNRIGVSFEQPNLYPLLSGRENLTCFAGLYGPPQRDPDELLEAVGLAHAAHQRASTYSKGMQRRLVLARALLHRPQTLFLDEPLEGLDPGLAERVRDLIRRERQGGATILVSTHNMALAEDLCDRVALIDGGELVALDSPRRLKLKHGQRLLKIEHRHGQQIRTELLDPALAPDRRRLENLLMLGCVETMHSQEASLEQVFLRLTQREAI
jgi:fluoroquinolone transport system ATP-binding protein